MAFRSPGGFRANYDALLAIGQEVLGFDPMVLVNIGLIFGAVAAFLHYTSSTIYRWAAQTCLSSAHINDDDRLYVDVMRWMTDHQLTTKRFRTVKATTVPDMDSISGGGWEADASFNPPLRPGRLLSYRTLVNRVPIRLAPFEAGHIFRFKGYWLYFRHRLHRSSMMEMMTGTREKGYITIMCLGRSTAPLKALMEAAQEHALSRARASTAIHRAQAGGGRGGGQYIWQTVARRPARDIRTVVLPGATKAALLADINEYLHPRTRRWYADHGVPYRRGYLFSGAPGSGKTSLTAAMAGVFGLDIYVLSLLDASLTESVLMRLLADLPARCILLLEDVDAAGLSNRGAAALQSTANASASIVPQRRKTRQETTPSDPVAALATVANPGPTTEISLSGLLNAIDGVASAEGRLLIMTTNHAAALDPALIRPGRVDMQVAFALPGPVETREIFVSMYRDSKLFEDGDEESETATDETNGQNLSHTNGTADVLDTDLMSKLKTSKDRERREQLAEIKRLTDGLMDSGAAKPKQSNDAGQTKEMGSETDLSDESKERTEPETEEDSDARLIADLAFHPSPRLAALSGIFADALSPYRLSLAAVQGYLLQHKLEPLRAVQGAREWAMEMAREQEQGDDGEEGEIKTEMIDGTDKDKGQKKISEESHGSMVVVS